MSTPTPQGSRRLVAAGVVGNIMEWYDFAIYGYFAQTMADRFFPSTDPAASLIASFGAFAAGFLMRPFGGLVFGHIGDRFGRRRALTLSVLAMAVPTFLLGLLPSHAAIGPAASVLVVLLRMVQGLSVGGEYTTSIVFLAETAPAGRRGLAASWSSFGGTAGILLGSAVGAAVTTFFPAEAVSDWAWRVPFLLGLLVGLGGLAVRSQLPETLPAAAQPAASPVWEAFRTERRAILRVAGLNVLTGVGFYLVFVYSVTYLQVVVDVPAGLALRINTINMVLLLVVVLAGGALSDVVGRRPVLLGSALAVLLCAWPLFSLMHHPDVWAMLMGQAALALLLGPWLGTVPAAMAEAYPARVRCTALSVGYNLTLGIVGGTTPLVATWLISRTHDDLSPAFLLMAAAAVSVVVVLGLRETYHEPLR